MTSAHPSEQPKTDRKRRCRDDTIGTACKEGKDMARKLSLASFLLSLMCGAQQTAFCQQQLSSEKPLLPFSANILPDPNPQFPTHQVPGLHVITGQQPGDITLHADRAPLTEVLKLIARKHHLNLVAGPGIVGEITLSLENAHLHEILDAIAGVSGHRWHRSGNLLYVTGMSGEQRLEATVQGRILRVFPLNYVAASDVQSVAAGLLSPIGQVFVTSSDSADKTKTRELLVVEDIPEAVGRVEQYVLQVDLPPRQVLIEVHVLQVVLNDVLRHGVNLAPMTRLGNGSVTFRSLGFANEDATMGMKMTIDGGDISGLVELIQTQANTRTLASPKLLVANRQQSNIQIGKRLSYLTTTTTQTAAVQSVQFLDTGVVLVVTPQISADDQVLLQISPKVSGGQLNPETNLPEEESTELSTTVLLPDGGGVIMGGLIKDDDLENIAEIPGLCRIPYLGHLFRRKEITHIRTEIIIALVAHIVPNVNQTRQHERCELQQILPPHASSELRQPQINLGWPMAHDGNFAHDVIDSDSFHAVHPQATAPPPPTSVLANPAPSGQPQYNPAAFQTQYAPPSSQRLPKIK